MKILTRSLKVLQPGYDYDVEAMVGIAERSRGTPRIANNLLKRSVDFMIVNKERKLKKSAVAMAMRALGIDAWGLTELDRRILVTLHKRFSRAVGVSAIAAALGEDLFTVEFVQEPWLVREGFIDRTPRGRLLTAKGRTAAELISEGNIPY
jgi:Holliday junction DNA helicase RuvB